MRCLHAALIAGLLFVIIGIIVVIWFFEGPDQGGYEQIKEPVVDRGISSFLGAYLPLLLLPFLLFFILLICFMRFRVRKNQSAVAEDWTTTTTTPPVAPVREPMPSSECERVHAGEAAAAPMILTAPIPSPPARYDSSAPPPLPPHNPRPVIPAFPDFNDVEARSAPPPLPPRSIPALAEYDDGTPPRSALPPYDAVVYTQLCCSPVPPGVRKPTPPRPLLQPPQQPQMQQSLQEGLSTPVFDRAGMKPAHSSTSLSRARVARNVNQSSKESAL